MTSSGQLSLSQRIRGGIYGALVGDALGVPVEFTARSQRDADPVTDMRGGGMWGQLPGTWSDDGSMLLCTAEASIGEFNLSRFGQLYVRWMQSGYWSARGDVFDIGGTTLRALTQLADGLPIETVGGTGEGENGNGSLMRTLPLAMRFARDSRDLLVSHAFAVSGITHAHARSKIACALYCLTAAELLNGSDLPGALATAGDNLAPVWNKFPAEKKWFDRSLDCRLLALHRDDLCSTGYVMDTLESALWCVHHNRDFASTVLAAVNLGGDTDTTGCVAGGLAGIIYGYEAIPSQWIEILPQREAIDALLTRFTEACADQS